MNIKRIARKTHKWGSIITSIPVIIILVTGIILMLKKDVSWIQPPTKKGETAVINVDFNKIIDVAKTVPEANISDWKDINRLDVRPSKGVVKIRAKNHWEIQLDASNGKILQTAKRRSDIIEDIHDGSFFHKKVKSWIFLPSAIILALLWITGIYLFLMPYMAKKRNRVSG